MRLVCVMLVLETVFAVDWKLVSVAKQFLHLDNALVSCPQLKLSGLKHLLARESRTHFIVVKPTQIREEHLSHNGLILCSDNATLVEDWVKTYSFHSKRHPWLIISRERIAHSADVKVEVDQQIFFFSEKLLQLEEAYTVNDVRVTRVIGRFLADPGENPTIAQECRQLFLDRRSNLLGLNLRILIEKQPPHVYFNVDRDNSQEELVNLDASSDPHGLFVDLLHILQRDLNFTTDVAVRTDRVYGVLDAQGNWTGMIGSLIRQQADLIATSVTLTLERSQVVAFLPAISRETTGIIIKSRDNEVLAWGTYTNPFAKEVWLMILIVPLTVLLMIQWLQRFHYANDKIRAPAWIHIGSDYWTLFCSYFARQHGSLLHDDKLPMKVVLFTTFLLGNIVYMSYQASLTSELSVRTKRKPFSNLEELLESDYR